MNFDDLNPVRIQSFLGGINYPATKQKIMEVAKNNSAPSEIMSVLKKIKEKAYNTPAELTKEISGLM